MNKSVLSLFARTRMRSKYIDPLSTEESPFIMNALTYVHNLLAGTFLKDAGTTKCSMGFGDMDEAELVYAVIHSACKKNKAPFITLQPKAQGALVRKYLKKNGEPISPPQAVGVVGKNIKTVCSLAGFSEVDRKILTFMLTANDIEGFKTFTKNFEYVTTAVAANIISIAICEPYDTVLAAIKDGSRLTRSGLIIVEVGSEHLYGKILLRPGITDIMSEKDLNQEKLVAYFLPKSSPSALEWSDFAHNEPAVSVAKQIILSAIKSRETGINILFYGDTGTGKTELAKLIADELKIDVYAAGISKEGGGSPDAEDRVTSLLMGQWLVSNGSSVIMFDELEDLFQWGPISASRADYMFSKQWMNSVLESNLVPTIWITNNIHGIDHALLRRFTYAVEFKQLGAAHRAKVFRKYTEGLISETDIVYLSEKFSVSPAQIEVAIKVAKMIGNGVLSVKAIENLLGATQNITPSHTVKKGSPVKFNTSSYCLDALNTSEDLYKMADRICQWKPGADVGLSLCFYGPPGTGKSEYVKYLAHRMGKPVVAKRASDILNMYLGESEKAIAGAFKEAEESNSILLFDEVDSFLRDRNKAEKSWEISQVNEFLQQMEVFKGIVVCTTNLFEGIDSASLRRFIFKIAFKFMRPEQTAMLFKTMMTSVLSEEITPEKEAYIINEARITGGLAPGDFAAVLRREKALSRQNTVAELFAMLKDEVKAKHLILPKVVGFGV